MNNIKVLISLASLVLPGILKSQCKTDTIISYEVESGTKVKLPVICSKYMYGANDTVKGTQSYFWNKTSSKWELSMRQNYEYNSIGKNSRTITQSLVASVWENAGKLESLYDAKGNRILFKQSNWNKVNNAFDNSYKDSFTFDANNNNILDIKQTWDKNASKWLNVSRTENIYSSNVTTVYFSNWNVDSIKWLNALKLVNDLDGNKKTKKQTVYRWTCDGSGCKWVYNSYADYLKDNANRDTAIYYYDGSTNEIYMVQSTQYDLNGCVIAEKNFNKDPGMPLEQIDGSDFSYYKNTSGIQQLSALNYMVYPNPANDRLMLKNASSETYTLSDACTGQQLLGGFIQSQSQSIDVSGLANGLYILKTGSVVHKIIINH